MIFRPELAKLIVQGKKSQTRRPMKGRAVCRYVAGKSYAVQPGRGKSATTRITVTDVRQERLGDLTVKDARREGFVTTADFFDYWRGLYGSVNEDLLVWVISFALGDTTDTPRMLAARPGAPHGDYVTNPHLAAQGEPEAVGVADLTHFTKLAHARDSERSKDPLRQGRDRIARELERMRDHLDRDPDADVRQTVRRLEAELATLNRKLAA